MHNMQHKDTIIAASLFQEENRADILFFFNF